MSEKNNILYLCVCMALSDHKLDNYETAEIIKISKKLKVKFHVQDAAVKINKKFKDDLDMAQDFYSGNIEKMRTLKIIEQKKIENSLIFFFFYFFDKLIKNFLFFFL